MPNLTLEQRLVKPALAVNPVPGHDLVVFRRLGGGGLRFHSLLGPNDRLGLLDKLLLSLNSRAYAVTRDQNLRHKVFVAGQTADPVGRFTLDLTLALRVFDPQTLVEKLESDPLGRLEREVRDVLGRVASRMDWSDVQTPVYDFEDRLLSSTVLAETGRRLASLAFCSSLLLSSASSSRASRSRRHGVPVPWLEFSGWSASATAPPGTWPRCWNRSLTE